MNVTVKNKRTKIHMNIIQWKGFKQQHSTQSLFF